MNSVLFALSSLLVGASTLAVPVPPPVVNDSLMVEVPRFGPSRYETVSFCLEDAGVANYQQLATDMQWETFEGCMKENT